MIIEDTEAFKSWLTTTLEPLCEADPEALSKYVFALVKKDKPVAELRASMVQQLDVFLQSETKKFVDLLFKTLETQVYTLPASTTVPSDNAVTTTVEQTLAPLPGKLPVEPELTTPDSTPAVQLTAHQVTTTTSVSIPQTNGSISSVSAQSVHKRDPERGTHRKSDSDKDDKGRSSTRSRHRSSRSPSRGAQRSRSRSWDRSRRSRSRERDRTRDRSRAWRNKSPPNRRYDRDRRRSWSRSNSPNAVIGSNGGPSRTRSTGNSRSRSRSPRYNHRGRYRNRSPPLGRLTPSRSRSRTPDRSRDKKEPLSGAGTPTQDSNHGDVDMRLTTTSQSIQSVVSAGGKTAPEATPSAGPTLLSGIFNSKRRCRDFDEKGYCMRGDLCPYDHGNDPVVLEDTALSRVLAFPSHTLAPAATVPAAPGTAPPLPTTAAGTTTEVVTEPGGTVPVIPVEHHLQHPPSVPHHHMRGPHPGNMEYNPDAPSIDTRMMWGRGSFRGGPAGSMMRGAMGRPVAYNPQPQRELISVPVTDQAHQNATGSPGYKRPRSQPTANTNNYTPEMKDSPPAKKKSTFDFARLGPRNKNPNNCSLELKKVPRGLNNITHLNNHFSKFGKIVNIQVSYEGDPEAALVTFSSHAEANAAYRSTEAVLNNRFIKVFWHSSTPNNEGKQENVPPPRPSVKERLGVPNSISTNSKVLNTLQPKATQQQPTVEKVIMSGNNLTKTVYIPTALKKQENVTTPPTSITTSAVQENVKVIAAVAAIKKTQEILAVKETLKKKQEEKRKEALKLTADLRKRKQELLDKQLAQQKALIERLEKGGVAAEQREEIMSTIKTLQESIEKIRKDLANVVTATANKKQAATSQTTVKKSKEEAQREILDAELDLFTKQQEGGDTTELQRKVAELKMEAHSLGLLQGPSHVKPHRGALHLHRGIHRGINRTTRGSLSYRGRGRAFTHVSVDHRPTKVLVSGYEEDEKTEVLAHFAQFGEIVDYIADDSTPSLVLNYKSRKEAELAMLKGRTFQDRLLSVTWCSGQAPSRQLSINRTSHSLMSTVHLHRGGHRSVVMVGAPNTEGVEEVDEGLMDEEEEANLLTANERLWSKDYRKGNRVSQSHDVKEQLTGAINLDADLSEDVLLQDDEEEEEDGEDRSWRR